MGIGVMRLFGPAMFVAALVIPWAILWAGAGMAQTYQEAPMLADAATFAPYIYTPYMGIVGSKAMDPASGPLATGPLTKTFFELASEPKELVEIDGASHVDLYDKDEHVSRAVDAMHGFFEKHSA